MAANFASASSQRLVCATHPLTAYPVTAGFWFYPFSTGVDGTLFCIADTGVTTQSLRVLQNAANTWGIRATAGGSENGGTPAGTVTANVWTFGIARFISATNRRFDVLQFDGSVANAIGVTSRAFPTSAETMALGSLESSAPNGFFNGLIGEFWYTATDIQADGAAMQSGFLRQLAYGGPFSVPDVAKNIIEYRSLRKHPTSDGDDGEQVWTGGFGRQTWTNTNSVTIGPHPPLPYWYVKPGQVIRNLTI